MRPVTRRQNILWHHQTDAGIIRGQRQKLHLKLHCICNHNAEWKQNHTQFPENHIAEKLKWS